MDDAATAELPARSSLVEYGYRVADYARPPSDVATALDTSGPPLYRRSNAVLDNKVASMYPSPMVDLPRPSTIEDLIATVHFYGMAEIPADLLACLEEIAADLAEDDGTGQRVRSAFPYRSMRPAG